MAAGYDGSIRINTRVDTKGFNAGTKQINKGLAGITKSLKGLAVAAGLALSVRAIVNFSKASMEAYAVLRNSVQRTNELFRESSKYITDFAENQAMAMGMATSTAYEYAMAYGNLFKGITKDTEENAKVTIAVMKAAAVIRSKTGRTMEDVNERIRSGILGNTEAIEALGINVPVAMIKTTKAFEQVAKGAKWESLTYQQQQQIRVLAILEQATEQYGTTVAQISGFSLPRLGQAFKDLVAYAGMFVTAGLQPMINALGNLALWATAALKSLANLLGLKVEGNLAPVIAGGVSAQTDLEKATDSANDALDEQAKAAKKAHKALAGFDELNVLAEPPAGLEGAGVGAGNSPFGMLEDLEIGDDIVKSSKIEDFLNRVKEYLKELAPYTDILRESWERLKQTVIDFAESPGLKKLFSFLGEILGHFLKFHLIPAIILALAGAFDMLSGAIKFLDGLITWVVGFLSGDFEMAAEGTRMMLEGLRTILEGLGKIIESVFVFILGKDAVEAIKKFVASAISKWLEWYGSYDQVITGMKTALSGLIEFLTGVFTGDWKLAWEGIKKIFAGVFDAFSGIVKGNVNLVIELINALVRAVAKGLNAVIDSMNRLSFDVPDWVPGIGGKTFGFNIPKIVPPQIPKLATGAVIPPNSEFLAVLGDQKHGRNIEAPEGLIRQIMQEELEGLDFGGETTVRFEGTMAQLIRVMKPHIDKENNRRGKNLIKGAPA